jgi:transcriptional regulator with XRE-family HTH domain
MEPKTLGERIGALRREQSMTQEALATELGITPQAVSKWENGQGFPDVSLLPKLAAIFSISLDELFGLKTAQPEEPRACSFHELPWPDDKGTLHAVLFSGHKLVGHTPFSRASARESVELHCGGPALNIESEFSVRCDGPVAGSVKAGDGVQCGDVKGDVQAGDAVSCGSVGGSVQAGDGVLEAASRLQKEDLMDIILLGNVEAVKAAAAKGNFDVSKATLIDPENYPEMDAMVAKMVELRKGKMTGGVPRQP